MAIGNGRRGGNGEIQLGDTFERADVRFPQRFKVVRVFTNLDGIWHVTLSRSNSMRDTFTISRDALLDGRYFQRSAEQMVAGKAPKVRSLQ